MKISTSPQEGVYQGSKWLKFQVLCEESELADLFARLEPFSIFPLTGIVSKEQIPTSKDFFLSQYASWIEGLKQGIVPSDADLRKVLACAFSESEDSFWLQDLGQNRYLVKISEPVIQVQAHYFIYSEGEFHSMSMGSGSIFWGLQFSFPQVYQDPKTLELLEPKQSPNKERFQRIREWVRDQTRPTPFSIDGKKVNSTIRIGKKCKGWIHPQIVQQGLSIYES